MQLDNMCKVCGASLDCRGGMSAHPDNWYCHQCENAEQAGGDVRRYAIGKPDGVTDDGEVMTSAMIVDRLNRLSGERNSAAGREAAAVVALSNAQAELAEARKELHGLKMGSKNEKW